MEALCFTPPQLPLVRYRERVPQTSFTWPRITKKCTSWPLIRVAVSKPTAEISSPTVTSREEAVVFSFFIKICSGSFCAAEESVGQFAAVSFRLLRCNTGTING
ncbi:hypothetical protein PTKIN_Ptkin06aG0048900 [Pterospermum kingtungense]